MPKVLVSNNSELLRHLASSPFRRLDLEVTVVSDGREALDKVRAESPALAILDAEMSGVSGYEAARELKGDTTCKVVLVLGKRINAGQMHRVAESGCDEVLIAPMSADELYDVVAIQLGMPRRGSERISIDLAVVDAAGNKRPIDGKVTNLSVDGARILVPGSLDEGQALCILVTPEGGETLEIDAHVVWAQHHDTETVVGASFEGIDEVLRQRLSRLTQWEIVEETERIRVVLKGDITEATNFDDLLPHLVGRVDFDLSQVTYMNSLGVRAWCEFLRRAPIQGYEFHACSIPFVLQASLVEAVVGRGTVTSFFAPYHCEDCDHQEDRLLQSAAILAAEDREPPVYSCSECDGGELVLDDIPERYLAFLAGAPDA